MKVRFNHPKNKATSTPTLQELENLSERHSQEVEKKVEELSPPSRPIRDIGPIDAQLRAFSREPFRFVLAEMLACSPTQEALTTFSDNHPDRWAQALRSLAILSGYHEKLEVEHNISIEIMGKSDAELLMLLEDKKPQLQELGLLVEGEATPLEDDDALLEYKETTLVTGSNS